MNEVASFEDDCIKLILIGEQAVGKSSILMRYCDNEFGLNMIGTAGVDFRKKIVNIESKEIQLTIFDTAGQQRYKQITKHFYKGSKGVILVYDVSDKITFDNLKEWMKTINDHADEGVEILLVANKTDLERQVSSEEGKVCAKEYKVSYVETSAKSGNGIEKLFDLIIRNIVTKDLLKKQKTENDSRKSLIINDASDDNKKKKANGCCSG